jgi:hypothetical protein
MLAMAGCRDHVPSCAGGAIAQERRRGGSDRRTSAVLGEVPARGRFDQPAPTLGGKSGISRALSASQSTFSMSRSFLVAPSILDGRWMASGFGARLTCTSSISGSHSPIIGTDISICRVEPYRSTVQGIRRFISSRRLGGNVSHRRTHCGPVILRFPLPGRKVHFVNPAALDPGMRRGVEAVRAGGVETFESSERGPWSQLSRATVSLYGTMATGWHVIGVCKDAGLPVKTLERTGSGSV